MKSDMEKKIMPSNVASVDHEKEWLGEVNL
jgi:hypothetical protein